MKKKPVKATVLQGKKVNVRSQLWAKVADSLGEASVNLVALKAGSPADRLALQLDRVVKRVHRMSEREEKQLGSRDQRIERVRKQFAALKARADKLGIEVH